MHLSSDLSLTLSPSHFSVTVLGSSNYVNAGRSGEGAFAPSALSYKAKGTFNR